MESVYSKLCNLNSNKSPGPDMLHPRVLYESRDIIVYPLVLMYNKSLQSGLVPVDWKHRRGNCNIQERPKIRQNKL